MAFNLKDKKNGKDGKKKVIKLKHDQALQVAMKVVQAHKVQAQKEKRGSMKKAVDDFQQDGSLERLNNLVSMIFLLRAQSNRIMAEIELLLDRGNLVYGEIKHKANRIIEAENQFFHVMRELMDGGGKEFWHDSDRFDVDFYNYMGIRQGWKPGEPSSFSSFIGTQNLIHVGVAEKGEPRKVLIGRDYDGTLWIADNDQCKEVCQIPKEWFPNIKPHETLWVTINPILKM